MTDHHGLALQADRACGLYTRNFHCHCFGTGAEKFKYINLFSHIAGLVYKVTAGNGKDAHSFLCKRNINGVETNSWCLYAQRMASFSFLVLPVSLAFDECTSLLLY